jgi:hypothetical protein
MMPAGLVRWGRVFPLFLLTMAVGCGDEGSRAEVHGTVTFEKQPVESGSIAFIPIDGTQGPATGGPIEGGAYRLARRDGPVIGPHRVEIRATRKTGQQILAGPGAENPSAMVDVVEMHVPAKYNSQSTLTAKIQAGVNKFDFDL